MFAPVTLASTLTNPPGAALVTGVCVITGDRLSAAREAVETSAAATTVARSFRMGVPPFVGSGRIGGTRQADNRPLSAVVRSEPVGDSARKLQ